MAREEEKKSSATAKTALGLAIGGLSLAAVQGGILGTGPGGYNGGGGLLGGLFGNNGAYSVYNQQKMDQGTEAVTELNMVNKYVMPMMGEISAMRTKLAINDERDAKNEVINGLLFQLSEAKTDAKFAEAQCCCEKNATALGYVNEKLDTQDKCLYDKLSAAQQCAYDRLYADITHSFNRLNDKTDANFALRKAQVDAQIAAEMCGVIKGTPYLPVSSIAEPYQAGTNILVSRHTVPVTPVSTYNGCGTGWNTGCNSAYNTGCNNWAW